MKTNYYLLEVEGGVEPTVHGPYHTELERDNAAKQIRQRQEEDDGLSSTFQNTAWLYCGDEWLEETLHRRLVL